MLGHCRVPLHGVTVEVDGVPSTQSIRLALSDPQACSSVLEPGTEGR